MSSNSNTNQSVEINDIRQPKDFKGITFSEFKKNDVKKELINNLYKAKIEPACYWSVELICAGHYMDLWDSIIEFYSKHVHIGNPKLIIYLDLRMNHYKEIVKNGFIDQELRLRNSDKIRRLFGEIIWVLCNTKKKHCYTEVKVKKEDFDLSQMTERFKAPSIEYATDIFLEDDPKELFIAVNEFIYTLDNNIKDTVSACYWMEWILEFESICKRKKEKCKAHRRVFAKVDAKLQMNIVWLIWDIFIQESLKHNQIVQRIIQSTLNIFCLRYTEGSQKRHKFLLYFIIRVLTEPLAFDESIVENKEELANIINNIHTIYKQVKKNEHSPGTDYLYQGFNGTNLEKTIAKLEAMNNIGSDFIPRIND